MEYDGSSASDRVKRQLRGFGIEYNVGEKTSGDDSGGRWLYSR